jgi:hypothetical protein
MKVLIAALAASLLFCGSAWANEGGCGSCSPCKAVKTGCGCAEEKQDCCCKQQKSSCGCASEKRACGCKAEKPRCGCTEKKQKCNDCERWGCETRCRNCKDDCGRSVKMTEGSPITPPVPDQGHWEIDPNCCPREDYCLVCCPRTEFKLLCCGQKKCECQKCKPVKRCCESDDCRHRSLDTRQTD